MLLPGQEARVTMETDQRHHRLLLGVLTTGDVFPTAGRCHRPNGTFRNAMTRGQETATGKESEKGSVRGKLHLLLLLRLAFCDTHHGQALWVLVTTSLEEAQCRRTMLVARRHCQVDRHRLPNRGIVIVPAQDLDLCDPRWWRRQDLRWWLQQGLRWLLQADLQWWRRADHPWFPESDPLWFPVTAQDLLHLCVLPNLHLEEPTTDRLTILRTSVDHQHQ